MLTDLLCCAHESTRSQRQPRHTMPPPELKGPHATPGCGCMPHLNTRTPYQQCFLLFLNSHSMMPCERRHHSANDKSHPFYGTNAWMPFLYSIPCMPGRAGCHDQLHMLIIRLSYDVIKYDGLCCAVWGHPHVSHVPCTISVVLGAAKGMCGGGHASNNTLEY